MSAQQARSCLACRHISHIGMQERPRREHCVSPLAARQVPTVLCCAALTAAGPHIVNWSMLLGAILSWGIMWPLIEQRAGDW